jgi:hypothetical protein
MLFRNVMVSSDNSVFQRSVNRFSRIDVSLEELDFTDYEKYLASNKSVNVKNDFPEVFLKELTIDKIEERCKNHKVRVEISPMTAVTQNRYLSAKHQFEPHKHRYLSINSWYLSADT